jgi:serine/threonine-protein kinase
VAQVGRALTKAHAAGLVHRDLKPANIFLVRDEDREIAKVLDFGVAKVKETVDGATKTGAVLGTPYYMSPEQARGARDIDHRSDLWALAVVTYQCLTGQLPFMGEALGDLFVKIIVEPLPIPSRVAQVPPGFDGWWMRAASRAPAERFQTAKELTDNLSLALGVTAVGGVEVGSPLAMAAGGGGTMAMGPSPLTPSGPQGAYQSGPQQAYQSGPQQAYQSGPQPAYQSGPQPAYQSGPQQAYQSGQAAAHQSGQAAAYQSGQAAAYQSGQAAAYQSGQAAAYQSGQAAAYQSGHHPSPGGVLGGAPLPGAGMAAVPAPARSGRGGLVVAVVGVVALVGGGGAFFATRSHADTNPAPTAVATAAPSAPATVAPSAAVTTAPAAPPSATATAAPEAPASAAPVAVHPTAAVPGPGHASPGGPGGPPPKPTAVAPGGRPKTDFGF